MNDKRQIGIVVPVLNDAIALGELLTWRRKVCPDVGVWVVDAGSHDNSVAIAHEGGAEALRTLPGRATQMNRGAEAAIASGCDVLWFLHADSVPSCDSVGAIRRATSRGAHGGGFRRRFDDPSLFLRFTCRMADLRCRLFGWFLGDQGLFVTARTFDRLGGFPDWNVFEDLEFSRRMRRHGRTVLLAPKMLSSGRRFAERGPIRQTLQDLKLTWAYLNCDEDPQVCLDEFAVSQRETVEQERLIP